MFFSQVFNKECREGSLEAPQRRLAGPGRPLETRLAGPGRPLAGLGGVLGPRTWPPGYFFAGFQENIPTKNVGKAPERPWKAPERRLAGPGRPLGGLGGVLGPRAPAKGLVGSLGKSSDPEKVLR